ncbi:MAG: hypothetical protein FJX77_09980 [Armatimonadetes bacterium]|nr:hypothetical protein [Armatimonadota bacterium]
MTNHCSVQTVWRIELLGGIRALRVDVVGTPAVSHFRTQKAAELFAYLALHPGRVHPREALQELLWPEEAPEQTRHRLSVALSSLRGQLEPPGVPDESVLRADRRSIQLEAAAVQTDVAEWEPLLSGPEPLQPEQATHLEQALTRYGGELLPGIYSDWVLREQRAFTERLCFATTRLLHWLEERQELPRALACARRLVQADPLGEEGQRALIRLYGLLGERDLAFRQFRELERLLRTELGRAPEPATQALLEWVGRTPAVPAAPSGNPARAFPTGARGALTAAEPVGGAVPSTSPFYVCRTTDGELQTALLRRDSIVSIKGAREVGKSSLLARGLREARHAGMRVVCTSLQALNASEAESVGSLLTALAESLAEQLELEARPAEVWDPHRGANLNLSRYLRRHVLREGEPHLVWGLDEVDQLFTRPYGSEILGLFRSWHNERALDPEGPWSRVTLAITYATEAHLHVADLNQSPFNVGTRLSLGDFLPEQTEELNRRYGLPLRSAADRERFQALVGGHPYLVRRGLQELAQQTTTLEELERRALGPDGLFFDHLRRLQADLSGNSRLSAAVAAVLAGRTPADEESFYRLRTAGVLAGESDREARFRCPLYGAFLARHFRPV